MNDKTKEWADSLPLVWLRRGEFQGAMVLERHNSIRVLCQVENHHDGKWKHVSISHRDRLPTWDELLMVKDAFFGDTFVIQILPPKKNYVNVHPNCLHLWQYQDGKEWPVEDAQ